VPKPEDDEHQANGLMDHFYRVIEIGELERLMMVIARSNRASFILYNPRYVIDMARHILKALMSTAYDARSLRRLAPYKTVSEIARKVRLNNLINHPLEEDVEDLIATVPDPNLVQYVEAVTAYVISIVATAQQTKEQEPQEGGTT